MGRDTTSLATPTPSARHEAVAPGVVVVWGAGRPQLAALRTVSARVLGRDDLAALGIDDKRLSRQHVEIVCAGGRFLVRDLDSKNGTFVGGERVRGERALQPGEVVRVGESVLVTCADVRGLEHASIELGEDAVVGPRLRAVWDAIAEVARSADAVHLRGETGSGKELAARHFHRHGGRAGGPFIAVNCAAVPTALSESLLFGARKGAYSGADADAEGYLQAADGGTLFLDEIAELDVEVQGKLLRALESRTVTPLGSTRPQAIDVRLVSATHRDLRTETAAGRFRDDLYYRVARPGFEVPALRDRREELPWLLRWLLGRSGSPLTLGTGFVEAVVARPWPGNVRELAAELTAAISAARTAGSSTLEADHLDARAGRHLADDEAAAASRGEHDLPAIVRALAEHGGKVATTARALGMHRNQLRRLMARHGLSGSEPPGD
jgi:DNA-binding NtrC family response regulator